MFFPLGTDRTPARKPVITPALIVANVVVMGAWLALSGSKLEEGVSQATRAMGLVWRPAEPWRWVTYAFAHADLIHLAGNMLFLWIFGPPVEDRLGRVGFTLFYLGGAAASGSVHVALDPAPVIGASGAVAAVAGAFLILFPRTEIRTFVFFVMVGVIQVPALWFIGAHAARDLILQLLGLDEGVAYAAHLGGYVWGGSIALVLLGTGVLARERYDIFGLARQFGRRREIREAARIQAQREERVRTVPARAGLEAPVMPEAVAAQRVQVAAALSGGNVPGALLKYRELLLMPGALGAHRVFSRRVQLDLANHLVQQGEHATAALAYEGFLSTFPDDAEAPSVRLMLALVMSRYLNRPQEARVLVRQARVAAAGPEHDALVDELSRELDAASPNALAPNAERAS